MPVWMPDGVNIAFSHPGTQEGEVVLKQVGESAQEVHLFRTRGDYLMPRSFSADGKLLAYTVYPPGARGDIARTIFYMHQEYGLPIDADLLVLLRQWNNDDPPDTYEIWRNDTINRLQGTRNPFIDDSALVDEPTG